MVVMKASCWAEKWAVTWVDYLASHSAVLTDAQKAGWMVYHWADPLAKPKVGWTAASTACYSADQRAAMKAGKSAWSSAAKTALWKADWKVYK